MSSAAERRQLLEPQAAESLTVASPPLSVTAGRGSFARTYETERGTAVRLPIGYGSVNAVAADAGAAGSATAGPSGSIRASAMISRYKYYSRIAPGTDSQLLMPAHVVPPQFLYILPFKRITQQSSVITIFSIWNTMMGTSLLSMPWAVKEAGFATSLVVLLVMTAVTFYTAYLVLRSYTNLGRSGVSVSEFSDVCKFYLGKPGELVSILFSAAALLGAIIVYWVLLSNFLFQSGTFIHNQISQQAEVDDTTDVFVIDNVTYHVLCPANYPPSPVDPTGLPVTTVSPEPWTAHTADYGNSTKPLFNQLWTQTGTVPFYLVLLLFPLVCIKSPAFFSKFNALGTLAVVYILLFVAVKAVQWGLHMDFTSENPMKVIHLALPSFPLMTGVLSLALFCHNAVITLTRFQQHPENNTRDLFIAYLCVSGTYMIVGVTFFAVYPLAKDCITQNLLDNIPSADVLAFTARIFLFVQMLTVFPLLMYILRAQLLHYIFQSVYPSWLHVTALHLGVISAAVAVAVFYPNIGSILRYSGALCGLAYVFTLPPVIAVLEARLAGTLTLPGLLLHGLIVLAGLANFAGQFFFLNK